MPLDLYVPQKISFWGFSFGLVWFDLWNCIIAFGSQIIAKGYIPASRLDFVSLYQGYSLFQKLLQI